MQQQPTTSTTRVRAPRATSFDPKTAKAFGQVLRALRERGGLAQDQFALLACIDRSYYGKLERGERQPTLGLLLRAANALGLPGATLVAATEELLANAHVVKQPADSTPQPRRSRATPTT
ncbi:MAG: helix-turn-helix transcriptional regulator [Rubrivivax sp.]|nr:helix-turn-helix transcriptional regulator [Rubrivivax sp.]